MTRENQADAADPQAGDRTGATPGPAERILAAIVPHVVFDGWSEAAFRAAIADSGVDAALARALFPRGGIDLALGWHRQGDRLMQERLRETDLSALRIRDRIATAIRLRLELATEKEAVRRGTTLLALPRNAAEGAGAIWGTADAIWRALGDSSDDLNWYSKRALLSGVYSATVLYWLGDESPGHQATWDFLDRRIEGVMRIEKAKAGLRDSKLGNALLAGPLQFMEKLRKPTPPPEDLPGRAQDPQ